MHTRWLRQIMSQNTYINYLLWKPPKSRISISTPLSSQGEFQDMVYFSPRPVWYLIQIQFALILKLHYFNLVLWLMFQWPHRSPPLYTKFYAFLSNIQRHRHLFPLQRKNLTQTHFQHIQRMSVNKTGVSTDSNNAQPVDSNNLLPCQKSQSGDNTNLDVSVNREDEICDNLKDQYSCQLCAFKSDDLQIFSSHVLSSHVD